MPLRHASISTALRLADLRKPATRFAEIRWTRGKLPDSSGMSVEVLLEFPGLTWPPIVKKDEKPNDYLVGVAGFEPATPASRTQCSTGLSHTPTRTRLIALGFAHRKKPN